MAGGASEAGLIGREHPLAVLEAAWADAQAGHGSVILLEGHAGVGKTRLLEELAGAPGTGRAAWGRCHQSESAPVLSPWIQIVQALVGNRIPPDAAAALVRDGFDPRDLGPLAPPRATPDGPAMAEPPDARDARFRLCQAASTLLRALARDRALLVILEDLQFSDATSLELLDVVAADIAESPVLVIATVRDEEVGDEHPLAGALSSLTRHRTAQRLVLSGLTAEGVARLLVARTGAQPSPELVSVVYDRTDGNPFFIEELLRLLDADGALEDAASAARAAVPAGVRAVVRQRLGHLSNQAKEVVGVAAVVGHEFSLPVLECVTDLTADELYDGLELALQAGVVAEVPGGLGRYQFSQGLIREAVYGQFSALRRARLHRRVAEALERLHPDDEAYLTEIAHHFLEGAAAGAGDQAFAYALRAADHAIGRRAYEQAELDLRRALDVITSVASGPERAERELNAQSRLTNLLISTRGYGAPEIREAAARARELCHAAGGSAQLLASLFRLSMFHCVHGDFPAAQELADQLLQAGRAGGEPVLLLGGHAAAGVIAVHRGEPARALEHLQEVERLSDQVDDPSLITHPPALYWRFFSGPAMALRGDAQRARRLTEEALALSHRVGDERDQASALFFDAWVAVLVGDTAVARARASESLALSKKLSLPLWEAISAMVHGWAVGGPTGIRQLDEGLAALERTGARMLRHFGLALLAQAHLAAGEPQAALAAVKAGLDVVQATGERFYEAELHRLRGEALVALAPDRAPDAQESMRRAIEIARVQGALALQHRAETSLAGLLESSAAPPGGETARETARATVGPAPTSTYSELARLKEALDAYEIGEELGRGACGVVVAGRHLRLGRQVAIKQLWSQFGSDSDIAARFMAEARVLAAFDHPHVVQVFDYVEGDGLCVLIMERLTGGTVKEWLAAGRMSPQVACAVVVAACTGLQYAHSKGVLHRDIKPQNLLLSADGIVKVADFGIAKVLEATRAATRTGLMLGTPAYMAPEQVEARALSPAVDVYAAGAVLYELLCGQLPFPMVGDPLADMYQRVHGEPIPLLEQAPGLPAALGEITDRALRRDPAERFAGAAELARAVHEAACREWGSDWISNTGTALGVALPEIAAAPPTGADARRPAGGVRVATAAREAPRSQSARHLPQTLERDRELADIAAAMDAAAAGTGQLVVIEGPAGIGKTRLVEYARELAKDRGFGRLIASGYENERALAWGVVRQLVERSVLRYSGEVRERILAGPAGRALAALDRAPSDAASDESALAPTLHALWWVAADLSAERPVLITIDDAQWADPSSLRFLTYLARRISDLAIVLVVAMRPVGEDPALRELAAGRAGERILPRPLSEQALAAFASARGATPAPSVVAALHRASGGNPFYAGQLLDELEALGRALDDPATADVLEGLGPATIGRTLLGRLGRDALLLAKVMAVAGTVEGPAIATELELDGRAVARAIDELVAAQVLSRTDELAFGHPVVREAVLAATGRGERAAIHAAAAQRLAQHGAAADRIAAHLVMAPPGTLPDASERLRTAARTLLAAGDAANATAYLRRALQESPGDGDLEADLGEALLRAGEPGEARQRLRAAARATAAPLQRARRLGTAASATLALDGPAAAAAELRRVLDSDDGPDDPDARVLLEAQLAGVVSYDPDEFRRYGTRLDGFAELPGATRDERVLLATLARRAWAEVRPAEEVAALARRALGDHDWLVGGPERFAALGGAVHALVMADDVETAWRELESAQLAVREGAPRDFVLLSGCRAVAASREGDVGAVASHGSALLEALRLADRDPAVAGIHAVTVRALVVAFIEMGDVAAARETLEAFDAAAEHDPATIPHHRVRYARAALALAVDQPAVARREAQALGAVELSWGAGNPSIPWRSVAALAAARLGDDHGARALADEQLDLARAWGAPTDLGAALRLRAAIEADGRLARLREAVEVLERSPGRLELAHALYDLGVALRAQDGAVDAREPLRRAEELARSVGASVLRERAHEALVALGERVATATVAGHRLTPSERRVAQLAAMGRSEREIAQELFVTPKAIENHLQRIYSKLGVHGAGQLSAQLAVG